MYRNILKIGWICIFIHLINIPHTIAGECEIPRNAPPLFYFSTLQHNTPVSPVQRNKAGKFRSFSLTISPVKLMTGALTLNSVYMLVPHHGIRFTFSYFISNPWAGLPVAHGIEMDLSNKAPYITGSSLELGYQYCTGALGIKGFYLTPFFRLEKSKKKLFIWNPAIGGEIGGQYVSKKGFTIGHAIGIRRMWLIFSRALLKEEIDLETKWILYFNPTIGWSF